ncbi:MAG: hypothetical protein ABI662_03300 [Dermatophilaceae bacterium]
MIWSIAHTASTLSSERLDSSVLKIVGQVISLPVDVAATIS